MPLADLAVSKVATWQNSLHDITATLTVAINGTITIALDNAVVYNGMQPTALLAAARFVSTLNSTAVPGLNQAMIASFHTTASRLAVHRWSTTAQVRRQLFGQVPGFFPTMSGWQSVLYAKGNAWQSIAQLDLPSWSSGLRLRINVVGSPDPNARDGLLGLGSDMINIDVCTLPAGASRTVELEAVVLDTQTIHLRYQAHGLEADGAVVTIVGVEFLSADRQGT